MVRVAQTLDRYLYCSARHAVAGLGDDYGPQGRASMVDTRVTPEVEVGVHCQTLSRKNIIYLE